ncbi:hypothetical protein PanWU01x14_370480, partial [Parasponia andersonii]
ICQNPDSLVSRILKYKYFKTKDFLDVNLGTNCIAPWRGIVWDRYGLKVGLRGKVGYGQSLQVFSDPWLPRPHLFKPITVLSDPTRNLKVSDLMIGQGVWDSNHL